MKHSKLILTLSCTFLLSGCLNNKQNALSTEQSVDADQYASEVFTESLSEKTSTDANGNAQVESPVFENDLGGEFGEQAARSAVPVCRDVISNSGCVANGAESSISLTFQECRVANTFAIANGQVKYTFNNSSCSLANDQDAVNREFDIDLKKLYRASLKLSTARHENYKGEMLGGGGVLTNTANGWEIEVLGRYHQLKSASGRVLADVSVSSEGKFLVTRTGSGRTVSGGKLVIDHNLAKYTAAFSPRSLTWDNSCLCPVFGLVDIAFSGSKSGAGSLEFVSCGVAKVLKPDGSTRKIEMPRCFAN